MCNIIDLSERYKKIYLDYSNKDHISNIEDLINDKFIEIKNKFYEDIKELFNLLDKEIINLNHEQKNHIYKNSIERNFISLICSIINNLNMNSKRRSDLPLDWEWIVDEYVNSIKECMLIKKLWNIT